MGTLIFKEKPLRVLISLSDDSRVWYANALCKVTDTTYPHMLKMLKNMQSVGLISTEHVGRVRVVKLTEKGRHVAKILNELLSIFPEEKSFGFSKNVLGENNAGSAEGRS